MLCRTPGEWLPAGRLRQDKKGHTASLSIGFGDLTGILRMRVATRAKLFPRRDDAEELMTTEPLRDVAMLSLECMAPLEHMTRDNVEADSRGGNGRDSELTFCNDFDTVTRISVNDLNQKQCIPHSYKGTH
jgi:hypothetical protein